MREESTAKRYTLGTHRTRSPEATWAWIEPHFATLGITRVADVTRLDRVGIPIFQAIRPASRNLSVSQGKAITAMGARVSAVMESTELWHAENLEHVPRVERSVGEMAGGNSVALDELPWYVRPRSPASLVLEWVEARALGDHPPGWLPRQMIELDLLLPRHLAPRCFRQTSNGLASGNCPEEAVLHGLCELVERHALHLASRRPERKVVLCQRTVADPTCRELMGRIRAADMKLTLYDLSWEAGIPVVMVDLVGSDLPNVWHGSGCHPSPEVALSRALTEAAQVRLTYISGARDDLLELPSAATPAEVWEAYEEPVPVRRLDALDDLSTTDLGGDLAAVAGRLEALGYRVYWVDLEHPELGIPVARAFVPGLREAQER